MRVIAGNLAGKDYRVIFNTKQNPPIEGVIKALFSSIGELKGKTVLDVYARSGSISIEAISRGAKHVTSLSEDVDPRNQLKQNLINLAVHENLYDVSGVKPSRLEEAGLVFDIVIIDFPMRLRNLKYKQMMSSIKMVKRDGLCVMLMDESYVILGLDKFNLEDSLLEEIMRQNIHGLNLVFYKKIC